MAMGILGGMVTPVFFITNAPSKNAGDPAKSGTHFPRVRGVFPRVRGVFAYGYLPCPADPYNKKRILGGETLPAAGFGSVTRIPPIG